MNTNISGKNINVGDSLRAHIEKRVQEVVAKYLDRVTHMNVVIGKEAHFFKAQITGNTGTHSGVMIRSEGESEDVYAAFDLAADRIEKQLRRYKRRLTNHHKATADREVAASRAFKAKKYVIEDNDNDDADDKPEQSPLIIAEKSTDIEQLSVSEAVMKMDLANLPALMFVNSAHGRMNIVYRRDDGNISWLDPEGQAA